MCGPCLKHKFEGGRKLAKKTSKKPKVKAKAKPKKKKKEVKN
jgi:hypothetical protein